MSSGNDTAKMMVYPYIESVVPPYIVDGESETLSGNSYFWGGLEILNGGSVTVSEGAGVEILKNLTLSDGAALANHGTLTTESITVSGTGNVISGNPVSVKTIPVYHILDTGDRLTANSVAVSGNSWDSLFIRCRVRVEAGADLTITKNQYDAFPQIESEGVLYVQKSAGNALRQKDIDSLVSIGTIRHIVFQQDLLNLNNLKLTGGIFLTVGFEDAYGTKKNDTICFGKNSEVTLGSAGRVIDLFEGRNRIVCDANAKATVLSDLCNLSSIRISAGTKIRQAEFLKQKFTEFSCQNVSFGDQFPGHLDVGSFSVVTTGDLQGGSCIDTITVRHNSSWQSGEINEFEKITICSGRKWRESASASSPVLQGYTCWIAGNIDNQHSLKIMMGNYTRSSVGKVAVGIYSIPLSSKEVWSFNIDESNDVIRIGKHAEFTAESIDLGNGKNSFSTGTGSKVNVSGKMTGIWNLKISDGVNFSAGDIVGTKYADTFYFANDSICSIQKITLVNGWAERIAGDRVIVGKNATLQASSLTFGKGNDCLEIRDAATVNISETVNFETGKDRLVIGKNAEVTLKALSADSLTRFSIEKGTRAYLSSELLRCRNLHAVKAYLYDIGSAQDGVARNFTSIAGEQGDNTFQAAAAVTAGSTYNGWLCGENSLDPADFFQRGNAVAVVCQETSEALTVSQWNSSGELISRTGFGGTITLNDEAAAFSVEWESEHHSEDRAAAYHFMLA